MTFCASLIILFMTSSPKSRFTATNNNYKYYKHKMNYNRTSCGAEL